MQNENLAPPIGLARPRGIAAWRDRLVLRVCGRLLKGLATGRLRITLPSGESRSFGEGAHEVALTLHNFDLFWRALRSGSIGFAESIIEGDAEARDLADLMRFYLANRWSLTRAGGGWFRVRLPDRVYHWRRANSRAGSQRNIAAHYDLGNEFYKLWLDDSMTYSSARYGGSAQTLEAAQEEKNRRILDALELEPSHRLLEIGCGWGGFAEAAVRRGVDVTAVTISRAQHAYAGTRLAGVAGPGRAEVRFQDYRDVTGTYDRIVSVEMIEAVGEENWPRYFQVLSDRLAPDGVAVLQAITIDEAIFDIYRRKVDFIQRYIFPGGMLPTVSAMRRLAAEAGLTFEVVEAFGPDYARTVSEWRRRFHAAWPEIERLGFDARFRRMWDYYLVYCEVGFERGVIDVGHFRLRKARQTV